MADTVRFGLRKLHRAKLVRNGDTITYEKPIPMKGAVSATITPEGSEASDFYADDGIYYTIPGTNGGYKGELVLAHVDDQTRQDLLGETVDEETGVQFETVEDEIPEWAYIMEMQGDFKPIAFCFYCGKASRITTNANTKGENVEVDTDTISVRFTAVDLPYKGETKGIVKGHIEKTADNEDKYNAFFEDVVLPTPAAPSTPTVGD